MPYKNKADQVAYYQRNKARIQERNKTPEAKKSNKLKSWKFIGVIDADISSVYDYYITQTHCWICDIKYTKNNYRCLDHNHDTGEIRYICCKNCNVHVVG
tara:strand:- start:223 stop:522 length:300 start_codon:yes stop_codon:yes gene_type:complete